MLFCLPHSSSYFLYQRDRCLLSIPSINILASVSKDSWINAFTLLNVVVVFIHSKNFMSMNSFCHSSLELYSLLPWYLVSGFCHIKQPLRPQNWDSSRIKMEGRFRVESLTSYKVHRRDHHICVRSSACVCVCVCVYDDQNVDYSRNVKENKLKNRNIVAVI